jgi:hypothetical protein
MKLSSIIAHYLILMPNWKFYYYYYLLSNVFKKQLFALPKVKKGALPWVMAWEQGFPKIRVAPELHIGAGEALTSGTPHSNLPSTSVFSTCNLSLLQVEKTNT